MSLEINPIWPWPIIAVIAAALLVFSHWTYHRGTPGRTGLLALRWIAIALTIFAMLRPNLVFTKTHKQSSKLVVLVDKSKSMRLRDMWLGQSRWEASLKLLDEARGDFEALSEKVQIIELEFARDVQDLAKSTEPDGEQTAIGTALERVLERSAGERLAGVLLFSDGTNTAGVPPLTIARQFRGRAPIYVFPMGRETATETVRDVSAMAIVPSGEAVFVKNQLAVRGSFSATGFGNQAIPVRLKFGEQEEAKGVLQTSEDAIGSITLSAIPKVPGDLKVTLEADVQEGELLPTNNSVSTYVTVLPGGISVLYIEGKYRYWEPKFVRWALDESPDIELQQVFLIDQQGKNNELPAEFFEPGRFDVIILGDLASNQLPAQTITAMRTMVENGAGLMMLGGYDSFGAGGWGETPLADILPVQMRRADGQIQDPIKFVPRDRRHFILRLAPDPEKSQQIWESLEPLAGANRWFALKPNALVLAESPDERPLLVAAPDIGAGRTLAFAGDTTWRWRGSEEANEVHARFWRQLILWLSHHDEDTEAKIHVKLDKRRLAIGETLSVHVKVENPDGTPVENPQLQAFVTTPKGTEVPLELFLQTDDYRGTFVNSDEAGDYSVTVVGTSQGKDLGRRTSKFLVYEEDTEMRQLAADHELLRGLAQVSGGSFESFENFPKFVRSLQEEDLNLEISQPVYESLWDRWEFFALFLAVITAEWVLRKRRGLV